MNQQSNSGGIGFFGLLTIVFITLKLTGVIGWSWLWVLSPILIPLALVAVIGIIAAAIIVASDRKQRGSRRRPRGGEGG
jgi:hypothetical protein